MHWFWRAVIAILVGFVLEAVSNLTTVTFVWRWLRGINAAQSAYVVIYFLSLGSRLVIVIAVYAYLTRRYYKAKPYDGEPRCRKCHHILRGLTEPRCPECGERI